MRSPCANQGAQTTVPTACARNRFSKWRGSRRRTPLLRLSALATCTSRSSSGMGLLSDRHGISDEATDQYHQHHAQNEYAVRKELNSMHSAGSASVSSLRTAIAIRIRPMTVRHTPTMAADTAKTCMHTSSSRGDLGGCCGIWMGDGERPNPQSPAAASTLPEPLVEDARYSYQISIS